MNTILGIVWGCVLCLVGVLVGVLIIWGIVIIILEIKDT